ncbi:MAG: glycoside hydrolase [Olpidium bornovanus]|uniref:alpha-1,2-Mannosidase n=1 Tax=Olpidium bornovanus TaxID=278681 RepID=A0A8H7ZP67_9FUNG|nr:MAG: glycoside hydrolase [Olpidium bornovanus]
MTKRRWLSVLTPAPPCAETASGRPELRRREGRNAQRASPQKAVRPRSGTGMPACRRLPRPAGTPGRSRRLPRSPDVPPGRRVPFVSLPAVLLLLLLLQLLAAPRPTAAEAFDARLARLRRAEAREMFLHAWRGYLEYAFPEDELDPLRCKGRGKSKKPRFSENDVLGGYSLTLVDTLDALAVRKRTPAGKKKKKKKKGRGRFESLTTRRAPRDRPRALRSGQHGARFRSHHPHARGPGTSVAAPPPVDARAPSPPRPAVTSFREPGGTVSTQWQLSAHQLASDPELPTFVPWYDGQLLRMAHDLGKRLLPAFDSSPSGIPYPKVNLRAGLPPDAAGENCLAGAGTLVLEFGVLSRLTDDARFETAAKKSMAELWRRRSDIDLLGNVINVTSGLWSHTASSVGAGADSFFEYLMKAYILFGECDYFHVFEVAYNAIMARVRDPTGYVLRNVDMLTGMLVAPWVDSLAAFFPGLQVLAGDVESAVRIHLFYNALWQRYGALPERFDFYNQEAINSHYPLRPEFIESTYMLYQVKTPGERPPAQPRRFQLRLHDRGPPAVSPAGSPHAGVLRARPAPAVVSGLRPREADRVLLARAPASPRPGPEHVGAPRSRRRARARRSPVG